MGKLIRRTITITIIETWTFVWAQADDCPAQTITVVQETSTAKEESDETLPITVSKAAPGEPSASDPTATALAPPSLR